MTIEIAGLKILIEKLDLIDRIKTGFIHSGAFSNCSIRHMFISAQLFNPAHWFKLAHVHSGAR
jgi:hypothetical protein